jgi:hypothetical protein
MIGLIAWLPDRNNQIRKKEKPNAAPISAHSSNGEDEEPDPPIGDGREADR